MFAYIDGPYPYSTVVLYAFLFGIGAGLYYECFRILRHAGSILFPLKGRLWRIVSLVVVFLEDILFFLTLSAFGVLFLYACNRGQLRVSILTAMALGFIGYLLTVGKWILSLHQRILSVLYRVLCFLYRHTLRHLICFVTFLYQKSIGRLTKIVKIKICVYQRKILLRLHARQFSRLLEKAKTGFEGMGDHI